MTVEGKRSGGRDIVAVDGAQHLEVVDVAQIIACYRLRELHLDVITDAKDTVGRFRCAEHNRQACVLDAREHLRTTGEESTRMTAIGHGADVIILFYRIDLTIERCNNGSVGRYGGEDYNMWVQLTQLGRVTNVKQILFQYRSHDSQLTHENAKKRKSLGYDASVKIKQLESISDSFSKEEKQLFSTYYETKRINNKKYFLLLNKIVEENNKTHFFIQDKLIRRVREQWESRIRHINNPFLLFGLLFRIKKPKTNVIDIKFKQLKRKFENNNEE